MTDTLVTPLAAATPGPPLQDKYDLWRDGMLSYTVERAEVVDTALLAIASKTHHLQVGTPGVAKTWLVECLIKFIGDMPKHGYFHTMLTPFSTPPKLFGPMSLRKLKEDDVYRHNTTGTLVDAFIAFLDEVAKCNDGNLFEVLTILNEREFMNGGEVMPTNTWSVFGGSNEWFRGDQLLAVYDRFGFRHVVKPISQPGQVVKMLGIRNLPPIVPVITFDEICQVHAEVAAVTLPDDVLEALATLKFDLRRRHQVDVTDRRLSQAQPIIQATAWWNRRTVADVADLVSLKDYLWNSEEEIGDVARAVTDLANPLDSKAMDLRDEVEKLAAELDTILADADNKQAASQQAVVIYNKLEKAEKELTKLQKQNAKTGRPSPIMDQVKDRMGSLTTTLLQSVFNMDKDKLAALMAKQGTTP